MGEPAQQQNAQNKNDTDTPIGAAFSAAKNSFFKTNPETGKSRFGLEVALIVGASLILGQAADTIIDSTNPNPGMDRELSESLELNYNIPGYSAVRIGGQSGEQYILARDDNDDILVYRKTFDQEHDVQEWTFVVSPDDAAEIINMVSTRLNAVESGTFSGPTELEHIRYSNISNLFKDNGEVQRLIPKIDGEDRRITITRSSVSHISEVWDNAAAEFDRSNYGFDTEEVTGLREQDTMNNHALPAAGALAALLVLGNLGFAARAGVNAYNATSANRRRKSFLA